VAALCRMTWRRAASPVTLLFRLAQVFAQQAFAVLVESRLSWSDTFIVATLTELIRSTADAIKSLGMVSSTSSTRAYQFNRFSEHENKDRCAYRVAQVKRRSIQHGARRIARIVIGLNG
jgi:hypothetical protein